MHLTLETVLRDEGYGDLADSAENASNGSRMMRSSSLFSDARLGGMSVLKFLKGSCPKAPTGFRSDHHRLRDSQSSPWRP